MFESLDFVYTPTEDVNAAAQRYVDELGAILVWKVRGMGTIVACLRVAETGPVILLADHVEGEKPIFVYRVSDYAAAVTFASLTVVVTFALVALSALASRLRRPGLDRPYRMPLWPLPPLVALVGVTVTVVLQTSRDLAIVAVILATGVVYDAVYLRPRRGTHWILLDPPASERDVSD